MIVKEDGSQLKDHRFAVGPTNGRDFLDDDRFALEFDRGPWESVEQYTAAVGARELACIRRMVQLPRSPVALYGPGTYHPTREKKALAVQHYLDLLKYLLPTDPSVTTSYLWHPDLHTENIFVHPDRPSEVLGVIDWQSSEILPLFDQLDSVEQDNAQRLYLHMSLAALYKTLTSKTNPQLFRAMEFRETTSFEMRLLVQNLLIDGEALYRLRIRELETEWSSLPGVQAAGNPPFPPQFSAKDAREIEDDACGAIRAMQLMEGLKEAMGELWPEKGIVRPKQFDEANKCLRQVKLDLIADLAEFEEDVRAWEEAWPFDD
ncbi:hypothetical protein BO71DRAFT_436590 [Aspergillus ellipticus CBS 707.79]|uniref:Altered inheritance of mitochondria protein 9, mitochondrial n=1 Tax=Aspergillus ellipticus CBS 707.79 TaxID=1448320 RepID=A0A319D937_9EURO|nr:hypothetical protein BO71DRAFT_436590 [Aspergillus ellipticus CBS 707.79]